MTCPKCGGAVKIPTKDIHLDVEGRTLRASVVGACEFCDYIILLGCEADLEEL